VSEPKRRVNGSHREESDLDVITLGKSFSTTSTGREGFCNLPLGQANPKPKGKARSPGGGESSPDRQRKGRASTSSPNGLIFGRPVTLSPSDPTAARASHKSPHSEHRDSQKKRRTGAEGSARKSLPGSFPSAEPGSASEGEGTAFEDELSVLQGNGDKGRGRREARTSVYEEAAEEWGEEGTLGHSRQGGVPAKRSGTPFRPSRQSGLEQMQAGRPRGEKSESPTAYHTRHVSPSHRQSTRIQQNGERRKEKEMSVRDTIRHARIRRKSRDAGMPRPQAVSGASKPQTVDLSDSDEDS